MSHDDPPRVAVIGAGWAGLAAALHLAAGGAHVSMYDTAHRAGGRARQVDVDGRALDNGQHILIGAYRRTLALMRLVGVDVEEALHRRPLALVFADGTGLRLPKGLAPIAFTRAVLAAEHWPLRERLGLLATATTWALSGFRCGRRTTVARLARHLGTAVRRDLIDPLCVAALNTPAERASGRVFLRVLRDALFAGRGAADLLLPTVSLGALLPAPALAWLQVRGHRLHLGRRVMGLAPAATGWRVDGRTYDAVVMACSAQEAARLSAPLLPEWSAQAAALEYEPIATAYIVAPGARLPHAMTALRESPDEPAQYAFDHGAMGGQADVFAFVVSGAGPWLERNEALQAALMAQATAVLQGGEPPRWLRLIVEKRATFRCTPGLSRPPAVLAQGLWAAGDYVEGPYPATLEGAVRSGEAAAIAALQHLGLRPLRIR